MQSADAATPAPTYGTFASSSSPCTVPSSPNGPCSTGKTTSTPPSVAGTCEVGTGSVSAVDRVSRSSSGRDPEPSSQRPSRAISTVTVSKRAGSSASSTERAEASEMSCSLERPPMTTATRTFDIRARRTARR